jgi:hypothetical protein
MLAYGRGRQAAQKKEFSFLSFYRRFFLVGYTTTTKTLVKSDVTSAAQAVAVHPSPFATIRGSFFFCSYKRVHYICITIRRGRKSVLSFFVQKRRRRKKKERVLLLHLHIYITCFFLYFGLWHFPGEREMWGVYYYI